MGAGWLETCQRTLIRLQSVCAKVDDLTRRVEAFGQQ